MQVAARRFWIGLLNKPLIVYCLLFVAGTSHQCLGATTRL